MRNKTAAISLALSLSVATTCFGLEIGRVASPPILDGNLDDQCWADAKELSGFKDKSGSLNAGNGVRARIVYDDSYLYIAFSSPHPHPDMMRATDNGATWKVHYDEHVDIAVSPDQSGLRLLRLQINPKGVTQVIDYNKFGKSSWSYGSFCRAEPLITKKGWNLEVAIPWRRICTKKEFQKGKLALDIGRAYLANKIDHYGVFVGYETYKSYLCVAKQKNPLFKYPYQLLPVKFNDAPPTLKTPFTVSVTQAKVKDYIYRDGKCYYGVDFRMEGFSPKRGEVVVYVDDPQAPSGKSIPVLKVTQGQGASPTLSALVECERFIPRDIKLRLEDSKGNVIAKKVVPSPSIFNVLNIRLDRDYYTAEKNANVLYSCQLPPVLAAKTTLKTTLAGRTVEMSGLSCGGNCPLDITALPIGSHKVRVRCEFAGKNVYDKEFDLLKKKSSEIVEIKLDNNRRGLLVDGKSFFPFGFLSNTNCTNDLAMLAEHGVNTISPWFRTASSSEEGYKTNMAAIVEFVKNAAKHNIYVMPTLDTLGTSATGLPGLKKFFPADQWKRIAEQAKHMYPQRMKGAFAMGNSLWRKLPRSQKNQLFEEFYQKSKPIYRRVIKQLMEHPNVIGYFFYDEPTLGAFDMNVQGKKLYNMIKQVDGYRPTWTLYSSYIPSGDSATDWIDCLGTDPYWIPPVTSPGKVDRHSISFVSRITAVNKKRADDANCVCWSIPMIENWSGTYKRLPTQEEFRCQSYLALIHGAKGLLYFIYPVATRESMDSLKRVGSEIHSLIPWLLSQDISQTATGISDPVQYSIRVNDRGEYLMLTANTRPWQVKFTFTLPSPLLEGKSRIQEFFTKETLNVENNSFSATLKPFAVKVYLLGKSAENMEKVKVALKILESKKSWRPEQVYTTDGRPGKRNILPNPSFEEASVPGVPDYYFCGRKDPFPAWGGPNSPWTLDSKEAFHGKQSLRMRIDKIVPAHNHFYLAQYIAPRHSKPTTYTISVYMKAKQDNAKVLMYYGGRCYSRFKLTRQWKRYSYRVTVPPNAPHYLFWLVRPPIEGTTVWVDAAQMEIGNKMSDFQE